MTRRPTGTDPLEGFRDRYGMPEISLVRRFVGYARAVAYTLLLVRTFAFASLNVFSLTGLAMLVVYTMWFNAWFAYWLEGPFFDLVHITAPWNVSYMFHCWLLVVLFMATQLIAESARLWVKALAFREQQFDPKQL